MPPGNATATLDVPYNEASDRYAVELWGFPGSNEQLRSLLSEKGQAALDRGELQIRSDLLPGSFDDFVRVSSNLDNRDMRGVAPDNVMHPLNPLRLRLAWSNAAGTVRDDLDDLDGAGYRYEFNMLVRGWDNYLQVGISPNPHGGVGFLEFRNLMSNYFGFAGSDELGRTLEPWNLNAFSQKVMSRTREDFFAVEYMDLHIVLAECGIGLHRHRDKQEVFFMLQGQGMMVVGDWAKIPERERCFEVRTLRPGHFAMLKGGQLHGLLNTTDEPISLFMFGGYD